MVKVKQTIYNLLKGKFLVDEDAPKNWRMLIFLASLALIMIGSSHSIDKKVQEIARQNKKMRELRDRGVAIFIVTHRIAELVRISDKATVMRDGKDVGVLEKKDLNENIETYEIDMDEPSSLSKKELQRDLLEYLSKAPHKALQF